MMRYATATAFRRALEDRTNRLTRAAGESPSRLRKQVVFQRLLARLFAETPDRWLLKGGLALDFRLTARGARPRATRDMDLARRDDLAATDADFQRASEIDLDDYFEFVVERGEIAQEEREAGGAGFRYRVRAILAGRTFEQVAIDIGSTPTTVIPDLITTPDLLDFAGLPPMAIPALPLAIHIAEKVHAYTRHYGPERAPSSRPKDLVDLALLASHLSSRAGDLRVALDQTFASRDTHQLPASFPPPPQEWARPFATLARQVGLPCEPDAAHTQVRAFLDPVLGSGIDDDAEWDVVSRRWISP